LKAEIFSNKTELQVRRNTSETRRRQGRSHSGDECTSAEQPSTQCSDDSTRCISMIRIWRGSLPNYSLVILATRAVDPGNLSYHIISYHIIFIWLTQQYVST